MVRIRGIDSLDHSSELRTFISKNSISPSDICIGGSSCLAIRGLRPNNDIDIILSPDFNGQVTHIPENIGVTSASNPTKYDDIGLSRRDIFENKQYYDIVEEFKIIRPEIELSAKKFRKKEKDGADIQLIHQYRMDHPDDWYPELIFYQPPVTKRELLEVIRKKGIKDSPRQIKYYLNENPIFSENTYKKRSISLPARTLTSLRRDGITITLKRGVRLIKRSEPTNVLETYSNPLRKIQLGNLVENEVDLVYQTRSILENQFEKGEFNRYDIIALHYILEYGSENNISRKIIRNSDIEWEKCIQQANQTNRLSISVNSKLQIIGREEFVQALHRRDQSIAVNVTGESGETKYTKNWLTGSVGLSETELDVIIEQFTNILYDYGILFHVFLWPPTKQFQKEILNEISDYGTIYRIEELTLDDDHLKKFVFENYDVDEDEPGFIEEKVDVISDYGSEITIVSIQLNDPELRDGDSKTMVELKEKIRRRFMPEVSIELGTVRPLIHGTDDYDHNREVRDLIDEYQNKTGCSKKNVDIQAAYTK